LDGVDPEAINPPLDIGVDYVFNPFFAHVGRQVTDVDFRRNVFVLQNPVANGASSGVGKSGDIFANFSFFALGSRQSVACLVVEGQTLLDLTCY
jgi:hypothetical protein